MIHELKIRPEYFEKIISGEKTFELRADDRNPPFTAGDKIILKEYVNDSWSLHPEPSYTGREWRGIITYVLRNFSGLEDGFCIFGIKPE